MRANPCARTARMWQPVGRIPRIPARRSGSAQHQQPVHLPVDGVPHACRTPQGSHLLWCHAGTLPIVQVILQVPVPDPKLQLLQEGFVFHEIQCIEDVESFLQRQDKAISPTCLHAGQPSSSVRAACPLSGPALRPHKEGVRVLGMNVALVFHVISVSIAIYL